MTMAGTLTSLIRVFTQLRIKPSALPVETKNHYMYTNSLLVWLGHSSKLIYSLEDA
jgi:hypothetical protein